jgi:hypothetical protein
MRTSIGTAGIALFVGLQLVWSSAPRAGSSRGDGTATAQAQTSTPASPGQQQSALQNLIQQADSSKKTADTTEVVNRFAPVNTAYVRTTDIDVSLGNQMDIEVDAGRGWTLSNSISIEKREYRQRDLPELTESFENEAMKVHPRLYTLNLKIGERYRKSKTLGRGRFGQDVVFDNQAAGAKLTFVKPILKASASRLSIAADALKGLNDFKFDRAYQGAASAAVDYALGDSMTVKGGGGTGLKRETSDIGKAHFGPMRSTIDSASVGFRYGTGSHKVLNVSYRILRGVDRKVMPPLGNTYEVLNDPSKAKQEETRRKVEALAVTSSLSPFSFLMLDIDFAHEVQDDKYKVDTRLTNNSESNSLRSVVGYRYASKGFVKFSVSTRDDASNYGPLSLSSYREREHIVGMGLNQRLGDSISFSASGSGALKQRFYTKTNSNPRDADYLYYRGDAGFRVPYKRVTVDVKSTIDRYETINIDSTLSGDNRVDYKYQVGPTITVRPAAWVSITQDYILKIEYTDFVFTEDKNYLNRTTTLSTRADFTLFPALRLGVRHGYYMRDTGSYLMREGGKRYSPTNDTRDNTLDFDFNYEVMPGFDLKLSSGFNIQKGRVFGAENGKKIVVSTSTFESGDMIAGFTRTMGFGEFGGISLDVSYVRFYGPYITPEKKEYFEANSTITLKF